jgi:[citrate (pro-3S)-lyase] ligase
MIVELSSGGDLERARALVERCGLDFEPGADDWFGALDEAGRLVGVAARAGRVLQMFAIEPDHRGGPVLGDLTTALVERAFAAGLDSVFVFTRPAHAPSFEAMNFALLASHDRVALLEYGGGLERWLAGLRALRRPGRSGAVVVNCNPFTLGHRHLVATAAAEVDHLFVMVVREDRSAFPFEVREALVRRGVEDLDNVTVLDTSSYAVGAATFPTYFLKRDDPVARLQMELDATLFAARVAPALGVSARFVGTEPTCAMTAAYNAAMRRILPAHGVALREIERVDAGGRPISASRARALLARGGTEGLEHLLPRVTRRWLEGDEARAVIARLREQAGACG